jgi:hypothetical protein
MAWGRALVSSSGGGENGVNGRTGEAKAERRINVLATGSVDQTIKVRRLGFPHSDRLLRNLTWPLRMPRQIWTP